jgi:hypothetical protein
MIPKQTNCVQAFVNLLAQLAQVAVDVQSGEAEFMHTVALYEKHT